jgi:hypothetical protein
MLEYPCDDYMKNLIKQGKRNRAAGKRFELKVREDLEEKGWAVFRNSNDVKDGIFKQAKSKWNLFKKCPMMTQSGFPDFLILKMKTLDSFSAQFVECKINGYLSKEEKEKVEWIKYNLNIPVFIASKGQVRGTIDYESI